MEEQSAQGEMLITLTSDIVAAHVSNNSVAVSDLPLLIQNVHYQMTPDDYRQKWNLPADYPMVAPNYAEQRRTLAKKIGLGTKRRRRTK